MKLIVILVGILCLEFALGGTVCGSGVICGGQCCPFTGGRCCGSGCCNATSVTCCGDDRFGRPVCCGGAQTCCGQQCCSSRVCCGNRCCPFTGGRCCGSGGCCNATSPVCCGDDRFGRPICCGSGQSCCGQQCCSGTCCGNVCCPRGALCIGGRCTCEVSQQCGSQCCSQGQFCNSRNQCVNRCGSREATCRNRCCAIGNLCRNGVCVPAGTCVFQQRCFPNCCPQNQICRNGNCITNNNCQFNLYRTHSQTEWGAVCGRFQPIACFRDSNFRRCFSNGLRIGCPNRFALWTNLTALVDYLPQFGPSRVLDRSYVNPGRFVAPGRTIAGVLGGELAALGLNLGFDSCGGFSNGCQRLRDLHVCDRGQPYFVNRRCSPFYDLTVGQIYGIANSILGGCCRGPRCNLGAIVPCMRAINFSFQSSNNLVQTYPLGEFSWIQCPRI